MTFAELAYKVFSDEKGEVSLSKVLGSILILMGAVASLFPSYQSAANSLLLMGSGALGWGNVRKDGPPAAVPPPSAVGSASPAAPSPPTPSATAVAPVAPVSSVSSVSSAASDASPSALKVEETKPPSS